MASAKVTTPYKSTSFIKKKNILIVIGVLILLAIPLIIGFVGANGRNANLISYQGDSYSFSYPKEWTMQTMDMSNIQGKELFLQPPQGGPPKTPYIVVEVAPASANAEHILTDPFILFKYTKADTTIDGINAQKYTTIVHAAEGVLHSTNYVFESKGKIYLIGLGYKQEATDQQLEGEFDQVVSSFVAQ